MDENRRSQLLAIAGLGLAGLGLSGKARAGLPGEETASTGALIAFLKETGETAKKWKEEYYDRYAKTVNEYLTPIKTINAAIDEIQGIQSRVEKKKKQFSIFVNRFQRAKDDPMSFRVPSIDPFTTDILDDLISRVESVDRSINLLMKSGETGSAKKEKTRLLVESQARLGEAAVRTQRNELEKIKKAAIRGAKDDPDEDVNSSLNRLSTAYVLESQQLTNELLSRIERSNALIYKALTGDSSPDLEVSANDIKRAATRLKRGEGSHIDARTI